MGCASGLAITLDGEMLLKAGVSIAPSTTPDHLLTSKTGVQVSAELGGRFLLRYLLSTQIGIFHGGSNKLHFVTPTAIAPSDTVGVLALPAVSTPREYVMLLDPAKITAVLGPRWVRAGRGIEYLLPAGFPASAMVLPWEVQIA